MTEYENIVDEILIFRDELKYNYDDVAYILKNICDTETIKKIYNNTNIIINNECLNDECLNNVCLTF
jgi:hypothetical protein